MDLDLDLDLNDFDFSLDDISVRENKTEAEKKYENSKKILDKWDIRAENCKKNTFQIIYNLITDLKLPGKGESLRIRTQQQINLISLIIKILDMHKKIDELTVATYTFNRESTSILIDLIKSQHIKKTNLLLSSSYTFRDPKLYEWLKEIAKEISSDYDFHLTFAWLHLKITLAKCGNDYYQFEGSMNYSTNNMMEQILFENNKKTYDYDYAFLNEIIKNRDNKALEVTC